MNDTEKKVIELELTQKSHTKRLDKLTSVVEKGEARISDLITVTEIHSQQIGLLISITKFGMVIVFGAVIIAVLKVVLGG